MGKVFSLLEGLCHVKDKYAKEAPTIARLQPAVKNRFYYPIRKC